MPPQAPPTGHEECDRDGREDEHERVEGPRPPEVVRGGRAERRHGVTVAPFAGVSPVVGLYAGWRIASSQTRFRLRFAGITFAVGTFVRVVRILCVVRAQRVPSRGPAQGSLVPLDQRGKQAGGRQQPPGTRR